MLKKSKKIKVSYDISQVGNNKAGCGFYVYSLASNFQNHTNNIDWNFLPHFGDFFFDGMMPITNPFKFGSYGPRLFSKSLANQFWNSENVENKLGQPDVVHANNYWCPTNIKNSRLVYTLYDLGFLKNHSWTTEENRIGCFDGVFKAAAYADFITVISQFSKKHFLEIFPSYPEERIEVIYPCTRFYGDSDSFNIQSSHLSELQPQKFWLSVGTIEPRKNQKFLAKVYAQYYQKERENAFPLVFAGKNGWLMDDFEGYLRDLGIRENIKILNYISDQELHWLYKNCYANLYPSLFEGFGMPVLEGMKLGAPTISTKNSSMEEILVNEELLLSPYDENEWVDMMMKLQVEPGYRAKVSEIALVESNKFDWETSVRKLEEVYHKVVSLPKI